MIIDARIHDLAGMTIRRVLPFARGEVRRRSLGPFVFLDHMGPIDTKNLLFVPEHPHIGLSTATYLFEGEILHRDSIGSEQVIRPRELNLMTAGKWITHIEQGLSNRLHGLQFWMALPVADEQCEPAFEHFEGDSIPQWEVAPGLKTQLIIGSYERYHAETSFPSRAFFMTIEAGQTRPLKLSIPEEEIGVYVAEGQLGDLQAGQLQVVDRKDLAPGANIEIDAVITSGSRIAIFGGSALDSQRFMKWNYVASSKELIEKAEARWATHEAEIQF